MHRAGKASNTPVDGSLRVECTSWASLAEQDCQWLQLQPSSSSFLKPRVPRTEYPNVD
jgi:hypothetical protein